MNKKIKALVLIHKLVYDTDDGMDCELFGDQRDAEAAFIRMARELRGYDGPPDASLLDVEAWLEEDERTNGMGGGSRYDDTFSLDNQFVEVEVEVEVPA